MTTALPPERPRRPEENAADEPRRERLDAPAEALEDEPDFSAEFDHPSGRLDPVSKWEP
jgi:hypothetical protein